MAKLFTLQCPECDHKFTFLRHPSDEPMPKSCPHCGFAPEAETLPNAITAPHVQNVAKAKAADYTYRAMEESAKHNSEVAAAEFGLDAEEVRAMQITDLKSNMQEGEIAAMPVTNDVSRAMEHMPMTGFQPASSDMAAFAQSAHTGYGSHAGLQSQAMLRSVHQKLGGTVVDTPSLEVKSRQAARRYA